MANQVSVEDMAAPLSEKLFLNVLRHADREINGNRDGFQVVECKKPFHESCSKVSCLIHKSLPVASMAMTVNEYAQIFMLKVARHSIERIADAPGTSRTAICNVIHERLEKVEGPTKGDTILSAARLLVP